MLVSAAVLFAVAAVGGVTMAAIHFRGSNPPIWVAVIHGLFAATALVLLTLGLLGAGTGTLGWVTLAIFLVAALGGLWLLVTHLRGGRLPSGLVVIHGLAAATAFVLLLVVVFGLRS